MATAADEVSSGRLILGVGAGWNEPEYQAFGMPFDHRVGRFDEALQILRPLLRDGRVDFEGQYYQARDCEDIPRGPRPAGPPLLVGGEGPRLLGLTARYAELGVQHIMFQIAPYTPQTRRRLTEALQLYRATAPAG